MELAIVKSTFKYLSQIILLSCASFAVLANVNLVKDSGFVRAMPPSVPSTAAYFTLANTSDELYLSKVSTPVAKEVQLHTLVEENNIIKMRQLQQIKVPQNGVLRLHQGGDHLMLIGLIKPLDLNQKVPFTLTFSNGQQLDIILPVQKAKASNQHHHHH